VEFPAYFVRFKEHTMEFSNLNMYVGVMFGRKLIIFVVLNVSRPPYVVDV
jgi:hypothetical protein